MGQHCTYAIGRLIVVAIAATALLATLSPDGQGATRKALVPCYMFSSQEVGYFAKPRKCSFVVRGENGAISVNRVDTRSLRWRNWGSKKPRARGKRIGGRGFRARTHVILSGRQRCDGSHVYTRATFREKGRVVFRIKLQGCPL